MLFRSLGLERGKASEALRKCGATAPVGRTFPDPPGDENGRNQGASHVSPHLWLRDLKKEIV